MKGYKGFLEAMRTEVLGFSIGAPWRYREDSLSVVLPIIRKTEEKRKYLLLSEAQKSGFVKVVDSGNVQKAIIENSGELPVFVRIGELFAGKTQERAATMSYIIPGKSKTDLDIRCVHMSKGVVRGAEFASHGYVPGRDAYYTQNVSARAGVRGSTVAQGHSWGMDTEYKTSSDIIANKLGLNNVLFAACRADDVTAVRDAANKTFEEVISKVPLHDNQIGMAIFDSSGFYLLDCYDLHESWKQVKEHMTGKESLKIADVDAENVFEYKEENVKKLLRTVLGTGFTETVTGYDWGESIALKNGRYVGEVICLGKEVVHLLISRI